MAYENRLLDTNLDNIWNRFLSFYLFLMIRDASAASGRESSFARTPKRSYSTYIPEQPSLRRRHQLPIRLHPA